MSKDSPGRRGFLGMVGASAAAAVPMVGSAAATDRTPGAKEIGVNQQIENLIKQQKIDEAVAIFEKHDIEYSIGSNPIPDDGVSTKANWSKSDSTFTHSTWHIAGTNVYESMTSWNLNVSSPIDGDGPPDGVGITFSDSHWEVYSHSWEFDSRSSLDKRGAHGANVKYDDPEVGAGEGYFNMQMRKLSSNPRNVYGTYVHSWSVAGFPGGISYGIGVGPLSVSVSGAVDTWKKRRDTRR